MKKGENKSEADLGLIHKESFDKEPLASMGLDRRPGEKNFVPTGQNKKVSTDRGSFTFK